MSQLRSGKVPYCPAWVTVLPFAIMNAKITFLLAATLATFTANAADERVDPSALPSAVKQSLERWRSDGPVKEATREMVNGRAVYNIEIEKDNAPNPRLRIAEDGTILRDPTPTVTPFGEVPVVTNEYGSVVAPTFPKASLSDLPAVVQQAARTEARGRDIVDIDREMWQGRLVYEIEFKERGLNSRVYIGEDGKVVRNERRPGQTLRSLFMGTQLDETPPAVQATVRRVAGDREIADIDRKTAGGQTMYRVEIKNADGIQELRIAEDGKVLYDSHAPSQKQRG
jgi:uncharacterized membrane protein YkoI